MKAINNFRYANLIFRKENRINQNTLLNLVFNLKATYNLQSPVINYLMEYVMLKNNGQFN